MNARTVMALSGLVALTALGQGTFQNLNFESAVVGPDASPRTVSFATALPGWTGYFNGTNIALSAIYNTVFIGSSGFALLDNQSSFGNTISNSTAILQAGAAGFQPSVSLAQTGIVPVNSLSLRFIGGATFDQLVVAMNGQSLTPVVLRNIGLYNEYGVDISAFAGQTAELRFTRPATPNQTSALVLDEISFSPVAIPEPGTWALLGLGSALFWCAVRRRRK
jgi:hypothetical protein